MKVTIKLGGMHCASCALNIEQGINALGNNLKASVNFVGETAIIDAPTNDDLLKAYGLIRQLGYTIIESGYDEHMHNMHLKTMKRNLILTLLLAVPLAFISMAPMLGLTIPEILMSPILQLILATPIIILNKEFYINGYNSVVKAKSASMETLVALGTGAAYLYSIVNLFLGLSSESYFETAGLLLAFISLGEYLEMQAKSKTRDAIKKLLELQPKKAIVIRNQKELTIDIDEIVKDDIVLIKPGSKIPVDGVVIEGYSSVDESMISGESIPVDKKKGDTVIGGTINKEGTFKFKATKVGSDTMLAQIVKMVTDAQASKAPIQRLADKISSIFVPAVLLVGLLSGIYWYITGKSIYFATRIFITVLVISCPCALGLATPTAIMVGTLKGANKGILIKDVSSLEKIGKAKIIVFDKTGTLTLGKPVLSHVLSYNDYSRKDVLSFSGSLEHYSEHPIAQAIINQCKKEKISLHKIVSFQNVPGLGVQASYGNKVVLLGKRELLSEHGINMRALAQDVKQLESNGETIIYLSIGKTLAGLISVSDELKPDSAAAINELKNSGYEIYMITGDNIRSAKNVASKLGINQVLSNVLPGEKAKKIESLQKKGKVIMVGDGVNDAVALTQADIGIALGSGTDVAIEAGSIVLVNNKVFDVVNALKISKDTFNKIRQNLFWAFFYNIVGIPVAAGVLYPTLGLLLNPVIAAIAMSLSSITVVTNSLLLGRESVKNKTAVSLV